jgi:hypothetical protein
MRKLLMIALVSCVAAVAANAQLMVTPYSELPEGALLGPRQGIFPDDDYLYWENTDGLYFLPASTGNNYGDDIHFAGGVTMTGWEFQYFSRTSTPEQYIPFNATVNFYPMDTFTGGSGALINSYTVTGLGTGANLVQMAVPGQALPAHVYMEVVFDAGVRATTGLLIAGDGDPEAGLPSWDIFPVYNPAGNLLGLSWFGGYTPDLPQTDPNYNPMGNFMIGIVPEPVTLGLLVLGGLLAVRRRR